MIQRKISRFGVLFLIFLMPLCAWAQKGEKIQTIVIDAGHGGKDTGALGKITTEKAVNLAVAKKFGNYIKENLPDVKVIYTRSTDKFVELSERAAIANRNNADVFISIHCNSTEGTTTANGAETYVMGESKNEKNLAVAKKENASILLEDNTDAYNNFDPNSTEAYILFSLSQSLYQSQSLDLAGKMQKRFAAKGRHDRGVQQAGFLVLWKTSMPSILVELGFINNIKEEQFLNSEKGQTQMALALYRAFEDYKREFEAENHSGGSKPVASEKPSTPSGSGDTYFAVQFASRDKKVSSTDKAFSGVKEVDVYEYNGAFRYISGHFTSKEAAMKRQTEVRNLGYKDAFVVAFINGERGTIKQAEEALKK
ncbi:MAG: N-acetylmuramoyl-L-alanine amidase [Bacteroidales bacterium]|nr:N-acetylmuramoyl-L-alanine amidase [Bacteroidales bacterium]